MDDKRDQAKGRIEEAAATRTDGERLKIKGGLDHFVETLKEKATKATEKMRNVLAGKTLSNRTKRRA